MLKRYWWIKDHRPWSAAATNNASFRWSCSDFVIVALCPSTSDDDLQLVQLRCAKLHIIGQTWCNHTREGRNGERSVRNDISCREWRRQKHVMKRRRRRATRYDEVTVIAKALLHPSFHPPTPMQLSIGRVEKRRSFVFACQFLSITGWRYNNSKKTSSDR